MPAPSSLSMNRLVRLKELVRVNEDNKVRKFMVFKSGLIQLIVKKLRGIRATYDVKKWDTDFSKNSYLAYQIKTNAGKFAKIYFNMLI